MLSLITYTKYSKQNPPKPHTNYIFLCKKLPTFRQPLMPTDQQLEQQGSHWRAGIQEGMRGWDRTSSTDSHQAPPLCQVERDPCSDHRDRRGSEPPWEESIEHKPKPHLPDHIHTSFWTGRNCNIHGQNSESNTLFFSSKGLN